MSLRHPWKYLDGAVKCDEAVYRVRSDSVRGDCQSGPGKVSSARMGAPPPLPQHPCQHLLISAGELVSRRMDVAEWFALPFPPPLPLPLPLPLAVQLHPACRPVPHHLADYKTGPVQAAGEEGGRSRPRGEKRPTPEDHKDDKYYERRKRNNQAAKKSRDARKFREDQIALRAMLLEQENRLLRAQLAALREEARALLLR